MSEYKKQAYGVNGVRSRAWQTKVTFASTIGAIPASPRELVPPACPPKSEICVPLSPPFGCPIDSGGGFGYVSIQPEQMVRGPSLWTEVTHIFTRFSPLLEDW